MSDPKLHHYVPQFYLRRFADSDGRVWVWDKETDKVFTSSPRGIAAEKQFYWLEELEEAGHDPLTMERQLADLEGEVSRITDQWLGWLRSMEPGEAIPIPPENRQLVALFIAVQYLRTAETRSILAALASPDPESDLPDAAEQRRLHMALIWDEPVFTSIANRIRESTWIFARNESDHGFVTSDHPVAFKTGDNRVWIKMGLFLEGAYAVFPWAPDLIMYCHPNEGKWANIKVFDRCLSPVPIDAEMADHENGGQVFGATRFVISSRNDFTFPREFKRMMATELIEKALEHLGFEESTEDH